MSASAEIIAELERRVQQRRQEGKYPPGLEQQLEAEFKAITDLVHKGNDSLHLLEELVERFRDLQSEFENLVAPRSHFAIKVLAVRLFNRATGRRRRGIVRTTHKILEFQVQSIEFIHEQIRQQREYDVRQLNQLSHAMHDRLMMIDVLAEAVLELENKVSRGSQ